MEEIEVAGFRFYPTEEELVSFYLQKKLQIEAGGERKMAELITINNMINRVIPLLPVFEHEPWNLPKLSGELCHGDTEQWFFFVPRQEREARGGRPNRTTETGYWKATGSPSYVYSSTNNNKVIGVKKTMVFYKGKAPHGKKTKWKINEYRAIQQLSTPSSSSSIPKLRQELSLCRVYVISGNARAFDRRPLAIEARDTMDQQQAIDENMVITSSHNTTMQEKRTSSPQSSFSGEDLEYVDETLSNTVNNTNIWTPNEAEPEWDWSQLDWL